MRARLNREYSVTASELSIDTHGLNFLVICGEYINGGYAAIMNFGVSTELSTDDGQYNAIKIYEALEKSNDSCLPKNENSLRTIASELSEVITGKLKGVKIMELITLVEFNDIEDFTYYWGFEENKLTTSDILRKDTFILPEGFTTDFDKTGYKRIYTPYGFPCAMETVYNTNAEGNIYIYTDADFHVRVSYPARLKLKRANNSNTEILDLTDDEQQAIIPASHKGR